METAPIPQDVVNQIMASVNAEAEQAAQVESLPAIDVTPPDTIVTLPGGYTNKKGDRITEVEVKELNGFAEEALGRANSMSRRYAVLLEHGVVRVGTMEPNKEIFSRMLSGDRDAILLGILRATYGDKLSEVNAYCPSCQDSVEVAVDLTTDVPVKTLDGAPTFTVKLRNGEAEVHLPDGMVQDKMLDQSNKSDAELKTTLLRYCVDAINGIPNMGENQVRALGKADRDAIVKEMLEGHACGPQMDEVKVACPECGEEIALPLNLIGLF